MILLLISAIQDPDMRTKYEALYYRYRRQMKRLALSFCKNEDDAEDAVQTTFEKLLKSPSMIFDRTDEELAPLITVILKNTCRDILRKKKQRQYLPLEDADVANHATYTDFFESLAIEQCFYAIQSLSEEEQELLLLKVHYGLPNGKIAALLNITYASVSKRLERTRKKLLTIMKKEGFLNE